MSTGGAESVLCTTEISGRATNGKSVVVLVLVIARLLRDVLIPSLVSIRPGTRQKVDSIRSPYLCGEQNRAAESGINLGVMFEASTSVLATGRRVRTDHAHGNLSVRQQSSIEDEESRCKSAGYDGE